MILCCGEALIDMIPEPTISGGHGFVPKVGGAVFNTAITLGRLGANAGLFTGVSDDFLGQMLSDALTDSGVDTQHLVHLPNPSSLAWVQLDQGNARYTFYTRAAADTVLTATHVPQGDFQALFFGGISLCSDPTATTMRDMLLGHAGRVVTMMDPNIRTSFISDEASYRTRLADMFAACDIIKVSNEDLGWIAQSPGGDIAAQVAHCFQNGQIVLVTKGADGAEAYQNGKLLCHAAAQPVTVADTIGAGDSFNGGFLHALSQQGALTKAFVADPDVDMLKHALGHAAQVAAITVSRQGANPPWGHEL